MQLRRRSSERKLSTILTARSFSMISFLEDSTTSQVFDGFPSTRLTVVMFVFDLLIRKFYSTGWTVSGGVTSHPVIRQDRLYPEPVTLINATDITDTNLKLFWKAPQGDWSSFEVTFKSLYYTQFTKWYVLFFKWTISAGIFGLQRPAGKRIDVGRIDSNRQFATTSKLHVHRHNTVG